MLILLVTFLVSGFGLAVISVPLILGRIPPNGLYGFRVRKTVDNPGIWYPVNRYTGKWLFAASLCLVLTAVLLIIVPGITELSYALAMLVAWLIFFSVAMVASIRYLNSL